MAEKRKKLSKRQRDILTLLTAYDGLTTKKIIKSLYPNEEVKYGSTRYGSVMRSLKSLQNRGLITKVTGQTTWKKVDSVPKTGGGDNGALVVDRGGKVVGMVIAESGDHNIISKTKYIKEALEKS